MIDVKSCCIHPPTTNDSARLRRTSWQNSSSSGHNEPVHSVPATMLTTCLFLKTLVARWVRLSITPTGRFTHSTTCLIAHAAGWLLGLGAAAEALSPPALRIAVATAARAALDLYEPRQAAG